MIMYHLKRDQNVEIEEEDVGVEFINVASIVFYMLIRPEIRIATETIDKRKKERWIKCLSLDD